MRLVRKSRATMTEPSWRELNHAMWNERVPLHLRSRLYDLPKFKAGALSLRSHEIADLGDVRGKEFVHLQCHFGKDTLSWARLGGRTGFRIHGIAVRQDDEAHPAFNTAAAETQLQGDFPDCPADVVKGSDLIEKNLTVSAEASLHQLLALREFSRNTFQRVLAVIDEPQPVKCERDKAVTDGRSQCG